jgi:hypothetical protein
MSENLNSHPDGMDPSVLHQQHWSAAELRDQLGIQERKLATLLGDHNSGVHEATPIASLITPGREHVTQTDTRQQTQVQLQSLTLNQPLRRALLEDAALVDFIRGDLEWLRVILLLYGGVPDLRLADSFTQYMELSSVLQVEDPVRAAAIEQLQRKPFWRQHWNEGDPIYNLAVYLDSDGATEWEQAKQASLTFDPTFLVLDTMLTPFLVSHMRDRVPGKALLAPLLEMAGHHADATRCASALLALLAVDPSSVYQDLVQLSRDASLQNVAHVFRNLVNQRLKLVRDGVILYCAGGKLRWELDALAANLPPDKMEDILSVVYRSFCAALPGPPDIGDLTAWDKLPYVNAEMWGTWLSGVNGTDARYNFAVVVDTIGKRLHSADAVTNLHRAHTVRFQQYTTWALDPIPPVWDSVADMYGEALSIGQESRSLVLKELLHVGIFLYSGVALKEADDLRTDAIAAALLLPEDSSLAVLAELAPALANKSRHDIERYTIEKAMQISDPVIYARVIWRIARCFLRRGSADLLDTAIAAAEKIGAGLQRFRAFERLFTDVPLAMRASLLVRLQVAAREIPDVNNRARALCRLALLSSREESAPLLREMAGQLNSIPGSAARAETMVLMRRALSESHFPFDILDDVAESEMEPWYRHKSLGLLGFELARAHHSLNRPSESASVVLHAVLTDVMNILDLHQESNDLWWQLTRPEHREVALNALLAEIAKSETGLVPLNRSAYLSLNALAANGGASLAAELLPYVTLPHTWMLPELDEWLQHPSHECFRIYASLLAAEHGKLDETTLSGSLDLLLQGKDITRYRAALAFHGGNVFVGKPSPQHLASNLGFEGVVRIGEFVLWMRDQGRMGAANSAAWTWINTVFDDPQILDDLVRCIEQDSERREAASAVISSVRILTEPVQLRFIELLLKHRSAFSAQPLLEGFCTVAQDGVNFSIQQVYKNEIGAYWQTLSHELIESIHGLPARFTNVGEVITSSLKGPVPAAELDAALRARSISAPTSLPRQLAECRAFGLKTDPLHSKAAAQKIVESASWLRNLFSWLRTTLAESLVDSSVFYRKRDTLLEIAGHCGNHSPAAVFNLIAEFDLRDLLVQATIHQSHPNGRAGAITLLGHFREPHRGFLTALKSAITDTAEVQQASFAMVRRLRNVAPLIVSELVDLLMDEDTALAYAASQLLSVMARHENTSNGDRKRILAALSSALRNQAARRTVCAFESSNGEMFIRNLGTLAQRHYQSLLEIVSIS